MKSIIESFKISYGVVESAEVLNYGQEYPQIENTPLFEGAKGHDLEAIKNTIQYFVENNKGREDISVWLE